MTSFPVPQEGQLYQAARPQIPQYYFCFCSVIEFQSLGRRKRQPNHYVIGPVFVYIWNLWNFLSELFRM